MTNPSKSSPESPAKEQPGEQNAAIYTKADMEAACALVLAGFRGKPMLDKMVDRFLAWPLPSSVCSDACVVQRGYPHRVGTNLLTADEARQMLEYLLTPPNAELAIDLERALRSADLRDTGFAEPRIFIKASLAEQIIAALRQPSSDKVLVPREPTRKMRDAGGAAIWDMANSDRSALIGNAYRAMLAAAEAEGKEPR